jgi:hypothetical protein
MGLTDILDEIPRLTPSERQRVGEKPIEAEGELDQGRRRVDPGG